VEGKFYIAGTQKAFDPTNISPPTALDPKKEVLIY
jgi:hypothetical protein